jgi:hypothetical protein
MPQDLYYLIWIFWFGLTFNEIHTWMVAWSIMSNPKYDDFKLYPMTKTFSIFYVFFTTFWIVWNIM